MNDEDLAKTYTLTLDGFDLEGIITRLDEHIDYWVNELVDAAGEVRRRRMHTAEQNEENLKRLACAELNVQGDRALRAKLQSAKHQEQSTPDSTSSVDENGRILEWSDANANAAYREGWCISNGPNCSWLEIQKVDEQGIFDADAEAETFVMRGAERGSRLHQKAWLIVVQSWQNNVRGH